MSRTFIVKVQQVSIETWHVAARDIADAMKDYSAGDMTGDEPVESWIIGVEEE